MISEQLKNRWLMLINHFKKLSADYRQMAYSLPMIDGPGNKRSFRGFSSFLQYEGGERWDVSHWLSECFNESGCKVIIEAVPKPRTDFESPQQLMAMAVSGEDTTIQAVNNAIKESIANNDVYSKLMFESLLKKCIMERREVDHVNMKLNMYNGDMAALLMIDNSLYDKYKTDE